MVTNEAVEGLVKNKDGGGVNLLLVKETEADAEPKT